MTNEIAPGVFTGLHRLASKDDLDNLRAELANVVIKEFEGLVATHHRKEFFELKNRFYYAPVSDHKIDSKVDKLLLYSGDRANKMPFVTSVREYIRRVVFVPVEYIERDSGGKVVSIDGIPVLRSGGINK